jgi:hydroxymethylpyrimidine pyrophosphatase-like HAD family hydrolase
MVKAIVTDVDGVIVGKKDGVNFPLPSEVITRKLMELHKRGIPVILNTAKFNRAVLEIIKKAELRNPHITDGGALIIDPLAEKIIKKHVLPKWLASEILALCLRYRFHTEFYSVDAGFLHKSQAGEFYNKRVAILQQELSLVDSLVQTSAGVDVIKIMPFYHKPEEREVIEHMLEPFKDEIHVVFSHHPSTYPTENAIITLKGVSKKDATLDILKYLHIAPEETLGIGDTFGDWNFMSVCGYVGVAGSHSKEFIDHAKAKGEGHYVLAPDADSDGFLEIVDYFFSKI